jgi:hypothetical protein
VQPLCQNAPSPLHGTAFYQTGCGKICGIFVIPILGIGFGFFSFHISGQRKEAKERRLVRTE